MRLALPIGAPGIPGNPPLNRTLTAAQASYTLTGQIANLAYTPITGGTGAITHGSQLVAQGQSGANVGPTALLGSFGYPGSLENMTVPSRGYWRTDTPDEFAPTGTYVYNNNITNKGGVVPAGGMTIDGFVIPAGTRVVQFRDFSDSGFYCTGTTSIMFRGCRGRNTGGAPGNFNCNTNTGRLYIFFGDYGSPVTTDTNDGYNCVPIDIKSAAGLICYRNYITHTTTGIQINVNNGEAIENWISNLSEQMNPAKDHLNGITAGNGGERNMLILRNRIQLTSPDGQGVPIIDTGCINSFQDFGSFPGDLTNRDGTIGYQVKDNYVAGGGYCFYSGKNAGTANNSVNNYVVTGNLVSTMFWPQGGFQGVQGAAPPWGSFGNVWSNNKWADGPNAGQVIP